MVMVLKKITTFAETVNVSYNWIYSINILLDQKSGIVEEGISFF